MKKTKSKPVVVTASEPVTVKFHGLNGDVVKVLEGSEDSTEVHFFDAEGNLRHLKLDVFNKFYSPLAE